MAAFSPCMRRRAPMPLQNSCPIVPKHEARERVADERVEVAHAEREQHDASTSAPTMPGKRELAADVRTRRAAPRDERPDARERQQQQPERPVHRVEERRADRDLLALHPLARGSGRACPRASRTRCPTSTRLLYRNAASRLTMLSSSALRLHVLQARGHEVDREPRCRRPGSRANQLPTGDWANACTLSMTPAARDERAEDRQQERRDHERHVPLAQHAALLLDHDRVQERGAGEPRQERRVLDGIPGPVAAPSELDVRPPHAERDADREEEPGEQRPAAHRRRATARRACA